MIGSLNKVRQSCRIGWQFGGRDRTFAANLLAALHVRSTEADDVMERLLSCISAQKALL